ncbi:hypothetical protein FOG48_04040 [Hanseniaspora uvarum]|nr:hypothetical protein FOG48_04040 [Hanseniaspora uvarum]
MTVFTKKILDKLFLSEVTAREKKFQLKGNKKIFKNSDLEIIKKELLFNASGLSQYTDIGLGLIDKPAINKQVEFEKDLNQLFIKVERELKVLQPPAKLENIALVTMSLNKETEEVFTEKDEKLINKEDLVSPIANLSNANERVTLILNDTTNYNNRNVILSQTKQATLTNENINDTPASNNDVPGLNKQEGM